MMVAVDSPDIDLGRGHGALMDWVAAVTEAIADRSVPILSATAAQLPGALQVAVGPDEAGRGTALALVQWAVPDVAVAVRPDQRPVYELYLEGRQRVVIICDAQPEDSATDTSARWLSGNDRDRIQTRLLQVVDDLYRADPDWHPTSPTAAADLLDAYFTDYNGGDSRTDVSDLIDEPRIDEHLWRMGAERTAEHTTAWARDATRIAQELLDGVDGQQLRTGTKPNRILTIQRHLHGIDAHCATKSAAEPIDTAIRQLKRKPPRA